MTSLERPTGAGHTLGPTTAARRNRARGELCRSSRTLRQRVCGSAGAQLSESASRALAGGQQGRRHRRLNGSDWQLSLAALGALKPGADAASRSLGAAGEVGTRCHRRSAGPRRAERPGAFAPPGSALTLRPDRVLPSGRFGPRGSASLVPKVTRAGARLSPTLGGRGRQLAAGSGGPVPAHDYLRWASSRSLRDRSTCSSRRDHSPW